MKVSMIKNTVTGKYYCKQYCWSHRIMCDSYFTERAAKWHKTFFLNSPIKFDAHETPENIVIEEYEMVKV